MDWYWTMGAFFLASVAFYNAYEANKKSTQLEKRINDLENKGKQLILLTKQDCQKRAVASCTNEAARQVLS